MSSGWNAALSLTEGFWPLLALDHGLTDLEDAVDVGSIQKLFNTCKGKIGATVMTYGMARYTSAAVHTALIVQCFGGPRGHAKVQVCDVNDAMRIGAAGVSVQIDFSLPGGLLEEQVRSIASFVCRAHDCEVPVLFMIAPADADSFYEFARPIRICQELGADLIKTRCQGLERVTNGHANTLGSLVRNSPPILLAGGEFQSGLIGEATMARSLGFAGYCVGRNIYKADDPGEVISELNAIWCNN